MYGHKKFAIFTYKKLGVSDNPYLTNAFWIAKRVNVFRIDLESSSYLALVGISSPYLSGQHALGPWARFASSSYHRSLEICWISKREIPVKCKDIEEYSLTIIMLSCATRSKVKAVSLRRSLQRTTGRTLLPQAHQSKLRKVIMTCPSNYCSFNMWKRFKCSTFCERYRLYPEPEEHTLDHAMTSAGNELCYPKLRYLSMTWVNYAFYEFVLMIKRELE